VSRDFAALDPQQARKTVATTVRFNDPYVLYVGSLKTYKNLSVLLKAFAQYCQRERSKHRLLIVGDGSKNRDALMREAAALGIGSRITMVHGVDQSLLGAMYSGADVFVMPSTMEGFGLPVIEAMACGTPVISSNATCLPEVGGDAALYFDPQSPEQLARHLTAMLASSEMRRHFRERGLERASRFTWQESIRKHLGLYREVLQAKQ
jgi:glycosyltransferase involved in cell wall biosynthesis